MAAPQHLQMINPSYRHNGELLFHQFQILPAELRLRIWEFAVQQHRLIEVEIEPTWSRDAPTYPITNGINKVTSGRTYTTTVHGLQLHSKLLRVNSESRKVALRFYRVHFPCYFRKSGENNESKSPATLYFNPEYDFMQVKARRPLEQTFVDFFYDLRAYDPQDIGLLNLALGSRSMRDLHYLTQVLEDSAIVSLEDSLSRLQRIIWVAQSRAGRAIMENLPDFPSARVRFNHSMPIKAITPSFDLLNCDPRPVEPELRYVQTACIDPRESRELWQDLVATWKIRPVQPVKEYVLFAFKPVLGEEQIYDIKTANSFLEKEEESWLSTQQRWHGVVMKPAGKVLVEGIEELAKAVRPAIGFWLFPAEALGSLEGAQRQTKVVFDMTGYQPELALSHLY